MKCLIIGAGGREHALAWKMAGSSLFSEILVCPGNPGMKKTPKVKCVSDKFLKAREIAQLEPDLVIIGPENFLAEGLADELRAMEISTIGPSKEAARIESSKVFAKEFMHKYSIPTASFNIANNLEESHQIIKQWPKGKGIVLKSDELASGKGVVVTDDIHHAIESAYDFMENPDCSVKTNSLLFEEQLYGRELSVMALCQGENYQVIGYAQDYKRLLNGNDGPNTGGMGAITSTELITPQLQEKISNEIIQPTLGGLKSEGIHYSGFIFFGLMISPQNEVQVIEYNARLGDPESQVILPSIDDDFGKLLIDSLKKDWAPNNWIHPKKSFVHIVATSEGYPSTHGEKINTGNTISLPGIHLDNKHEAGIAYFAGVDEIDGELINSGGRVLGLTTSDSTIKKARKKTIESMKQINFNGIHWRDDIGLFN